MAHFCFSLTSAVFDLTLIGVSTVEEVDTLELLTAHNLPSGRGYLNKKVVQVTCFNFSQYFWEFNLRNVVLIFALCVLTQSTFL